MTNEAMKKQYRDLKSKHPDAMLLFRCGDFYETYEDDARECAKALGITLTKRQSDGWLWRDSPTMHSTPICPSWYARGIVSLSATNWTRRQGLSLSVARLSTIQVTIKIRRTKL